jgi:DNA-binding transcriptional LysR family regulator
MALTATGNALLASARPALASLEQAFAEARRLARGQSEKLRIGYLMSAAAEYLNPALAALRREHPEVKVKLLDLSPGEQIAALQRGDIDLGFIGSAGVPPACDFYTRRIASVPMFVALAENHPLAASDSLRLAQLRGELFVGASEADLPGHNRWIIQQCRRAGFRPRFVADADSLTHAFAVVVSEGAVGFVPEYAAKTNVPGVVFRRLRDEGAKWELVLVWQRGQMSAPVRAMLAQIAVR